MVGFHNIKTRKKISDSVKKTHWSKTDIREKTIKKISKAHQKKEVTYTRIHGWLIKNFGKADKCENKKCERKSKTYDYALKKGETYARDRKRYFMLCRSCHIKYDAIYSGKTIKCKICRSELYVSPCRKNKKYCSDKCRIKALKT